MTEKTEPTNRTLPDYHEIHPRTRGIAGCWHGIIEKTRAPYNGTMGYTSRVNVEMKSVADLMSHYSKSKKI